MHSLLISSWICPLSSTYFTWYGAFFLIFLITVYRGRRWIILIDNLYFKSVRVCWIVHQCGYGKKKAKCCRTLVWYIVPRKCNKLAISYKILDCVLPMTHIVLVRVHVRVRVHACACVCVKFRLLFCIILYWSDLSVSRKHGPTCPILPVLCKQYFPEMQPPSWLHLTSDKPRPSSTLGVCCWLSQVSATWK